MTTIRVSQLLCVASVGALLTFVCWAMWDAPAWQGLIGLYLCFAAFAATSVEARNAERAKERDHAGD